MSAVPGQGSQPYSSGYLLIDPNSIILADVERITKMTTAHSIKFRIVRIGFRKGCEQNYSLMSVQIKLVELVPCEQSKSPL